MDDDNQHKQPAAPEKFQRECIKCRKLFAPRDRKANWYCDRCRTLISRTGGPREVPEPYLGQSDCGWYEP